MLDGGVSDARFSRSFSAIDWSAADALDSEDVSVSDGRVSSAGFVCTCVEFARGGSGGGTGRAAGGAAASGGGGGSEVSPSPSDRVLPGAESWSRPVNPVCDTGAGSLCCVLAVAGFFHRRYTLCSGAFFCSCGTAGGGGAYPIDMTSPRWLAWMPGMVIVLGGSGWVRTGTYGRSGSSGAMPNTCVALWCDEPDT